MQVRIRFKAASPVRGLKPEASRAVAASTAVLKPLALFAAGIGSWRLASDVKWTVAPTHSDDLLSHWQLWAAIGIAVQFCAYLLGRDAQE